MSLRLRMRPEAAADLRSLDGAAITPDRLGGLSPLDAARLPACDLGTGANPARGAFAAPAPATRARATRVIPTLGDLFAIDTGSDATPDTITIEGDLGGVARLGAGMSRGRLLLAGDAGPLAGEGMTGGALVIDGAAGDRPGAPAAGGTRGLDGGVIVVRGAAGAMAGFRMRRGTLYIGGPSGPAAGAALIAGTLVLARAPGPDAAALMRRGTIVVLEPFIPGATFARAGRTTAPWLKPWWDALRGAGVPLPEGIAGSRFTRFCGDLACGGRGEILILEGDP